MLAYSILHTSIIRILSSILRNIRFFIPSSFRPHLFCREIIRLLGSIIQRNHLIFKDDSLLVYGMVTVQPKS